MAHNIFGTRFLGNRAPAWHGLGTTFDEPLSLVDAVSKANMIYQIEKFPVFAHTPWGQIELQDEVAAVRHPTDDDPQPRVFNTVSKKYNILQNADLANLINPLSKKWPVETVGALGYGETIFFVLKSDTATVKKEEIEKYFLVTDDKGGGKALRIAFTPVRVVCQNTLTTALKSATTTVSLRHYSSLRDDVQFHVGLIGRMQDIERQVMEEFNSLTTKKLNSEQVNFVVNNTYPLPPKPRKTQLVEDFPSLQDVKGVNQLVVKKYLDAKENYEKHVERVEVVRAGVNKLYTEFPQTDVANTAWALWNSIVEVEDYRRGGNAQASALFGSRAATKSRAYELVSKA